MRKKQKYDNRFFETDKVMQVLSVYYGVVSVDEHLGIARARYPYSWQKRTLIRVHRCEYSRTPYGLGYGFDWKGRKTVIRANGKKEELTSRAIKTDLIEYLQEDRVPGYAMKVAAEQLRFAETVRWMIHC